MAAGICLQLWQGAEASLAVEAVMEAVRGGALGRAVLYEVAAEGREGKNLKECTKDADGKVNLMDGHGWCGRKGWGEATGNNPLN